MADVKQNPVSNPLKIRQELPLHPGDHADNRPLALRVDGLMSKPLVLTTADLECLPQQELTADFICLEGWTVPSLRWSGVLLTTLLSLVGANAEARYVQASAEDFNISLPLDRIERVLIAVRLGGRALPREHGGPFRLVVPEGECFTNIKWLDHLELRAEPGPNTAKAIAVGRLSSAETPK